MRQHGVRVVHRPAGNSRGPATDLRPRSVPPVLPARCWSRRRLRPGSPPRKLLRRVCTAQPRAVGSNRTARSGNEPCTRGRRRGAQRGVQGGTGENVDRVTQLEFSTVAEQGRQPDSVDGVVRERVFVEPCHRAQRLGGDAAAAWFLAFGRVIEQKHFVPLCGQKETGVAARQPGADHSDSHMTQYTRILRFPHEQDLQNSPSFETSRLPSRSPPLLSAGAHPIGLIAVTVRLPASRYTAAGLCFRGHLKTGDCRLQFWLRRSAALWSHLAFWRA